MYQLCFDLALNSSKVQPIKSMTIRLPVIAIFSKLILKPIIHLTYQFMHTIKQLVTIKTNQNLSTTNSIVICNAF